MSSDPSPSVDSRGDGLVERGFWEPHASPQSVWPFVAMYPLVILAIYRRSRGLFAGILLAVGVNLRVVSPPETDEAWSTLVVLGERVWLEEGVLSSTESLGVMAVGGAVQVYTFRAAARRQPLRTAVATLASMSLMFLFFDRMVRLYDSRTE